jgi:hypothetical protein
MDGRRLLGRAHGLILVASVAAGALLVAHAVLATFTTGESVVSQPHRSAAVELVLDAGGVAALEAPAVELLPGDVREALVVVRPAAGSADLGALTYTLRGDLVADDTPVGLDPDARNVLDEPSTRALSVEVRRCDAGSTYRTREVSAPVTAVDVYCDRDSTGTPGAFDAGDTDGVLVGDAIDVLDGAAAPTPALAIDAGPVGPAGLALNVRVVFADAGNQNDLQRETFTLTHEFAAGAARAAGNV